MHKHFLKFKNIKLASFEYRLNEHFYQKIRFTYLGQKKPIFCPRETAFLPIICKTMC